MKRTLPGKSLLVLVIAGAAVVALTACDSGDPVDMPDAADVAGRYEFERLEFVPQSPAVQSINVLDTLVADRTQLFLSSDAKYILSFEFTNGSPFFLLGNFEVTERSVRIRGDRDDRQSYRRLLLEEEITLRRDPNNPRELTAEIQKTINPAEFSRRFEGVSSLSGTLFIRLAEQ